MLDASPRATFLAFLLVASRLEPMPKPSPAVEALDREYLLIRAHILEIASALDRIDRGAGSVAADPRMQLVREGLETLLGSAADRAERVQLIFSDPYDDAWMQRFERAR